MSFSRKVKEELSRQISKSRHCQLAEIAAILGFSGKVEGEGEKAALSVYTENVALARKYFTLIKNAFGINASLSVRHFQKGRTCTVSVLEKEEICKVLSAIKWINEQGMYVKGNELADGRLVQNACCKRAFIRGAFLSVGSMSEPEKSYHLEFVCPDEGKAEQMRHIINSFGLDAKIVQRKKCYVVYLKEGEQIVDVLNVMEAHVSLMDLENVRVLKEVRNSVNRQVNCETANLKKTVNAAMKQVEDIQFIESTIGLKSLDDALREVAELRLQYTDLPLKELGTLLNPTVGKSGVNHRLRKISNIAEDIRKNNKHSEGNPLLGQENR